MADLSLDDIIKKKKGSNATGSLSLDDIIKKKKIQFRDPKASNNQNARPTNNRRNFPENRVPQKKGIGSFGPGIGSLGAGIGNMGEDLRDRIAQKNNIGIDARNKLIQKKKLKMGDARSQIRPQAGQVDARAQIRPQAGPVDARDRISKRNGSSGVAASRLGGQMKTTSMNGRQLGVSRLGSQTKTMRSSGNRPMRVAEPKYQDLGMQDDIYDEPSMTMTPDMVWENSYPQEPIYRQAPPVVVEEVYAPPPPPKREVIYVDQYGAPIREPIRERPVYVDEYGAPIRERPVYADEYDAPIRERTVYVDEYGAPIRERPVYVEAPARRPAPVRVVQARPMSSYEAPVRRMSSPVYVEEPVRRSAPVRVQKSVSSGLAARMDQQPSRPSMAGRMKQQQPQSQRGTKLLVTNLNSAVSGEDVEELFETIGKTISVRMLRKGVAEVFFVKREDATKSVKVFNNRELDGCPMGVRIIS